MIRGQSNQGGSGSTTLALVANNCQVNSNSFVDLNPCKNFRSKHKSGPTGYTLKKIVHVNGGFTTNGEINGGFDFNIKSSVLLNGNYKQATYGGSTTGFVPKEWGEAYGDVDVYIPPNTEFHINSYVEAASAARSLVTIAGISIGATTTITYTGVAPENGDVIRFSSIGGTVGLTGVITGATRANPCVITDVGHGLTTGQMITIAAVGGMTQLNGNAYLVTVLTPDTFSLSTLAGAAVDSSAYGTYTSGGTWASGLNYATNGGIEFTVANVNTGANTYEVRTSAGGAVVSTGWGAWTSGGVSNIPYDWKYGHISTQFHGGGVLAFPYASRVDYTMGVGLPGGALPANCLPINANVVSGGVLNTGTSTIFRNQQGSAALNGVGATYTSGLSLGMYYGAAGQNQAGSQFAGGGVTGNSNNSGGLVSSISVNNGGSGHDPDALPLPFLGGGGGFGGSTQLMYGPAALLGIPDDDTVPSIIGFGDSVMAAMMSADSTGDIYGNFGVYEQAVANRAGFMKLACNGTSFVGWAANNTRQLAFMSNLIAAGFRPTVAILGFGSNDFASSNYSDQVARVAASATAAIATLKAIGIPKVVTTTIKPRVAVSGSSTITGAITGATQANPCVITDTAHGLSTGAIISIASVGGMTQLNGNTYQVTVLTANTFSLQDLTGANINSTAFGAYTSGGTWTFTFRSLAGQNGITVDDGVNPVTSDNFGPAGRVLTYNQGIRTGTLVPTQDGYLDLAILMAASGADNYRFRTEGWFYLGYRTQVAFVNDGIHPNLGAGIPYAAIWMDVRPLGIERTALLPSASSLRIPRNGEIGQRLIANVPAASAVSLTTATPANITSLVLPAGMWAIFGKAQYTLTGASTTNFKLGISQVTGALSANAASTFNMPAIFTTLSDTLDINVPNIDPIVVPVGKTTTVFIVAQATFSAGTVAAYGSFEAVRIADLE